MKKVTLVFYEFPAALAEINFWESFMNDKIEKKVYGDISIVHDNKVIRFTYYMKNGEILECFSNSYFSFEEVLVTMRSHLPCFYNKTLLFGKFDLRQLNKISKVMQICILNYSENVIVEAKFNE
jgi:hypothetical protein